MRHILCVLLTLVAAAMANLASEPGQPPDCDDWIIQEPDISCVTFSTFPYDDCVHSQKYTSVAPGRCAKWTQVDSLFDNEGSVIWIDNVYDPDECLEYDVTRVMRYDGQTESVIATFCPYHDGICEKSVSLRINRFGHPGHAWTVDHQMMFDAVNGRLVIQLLRSGCGDPKTVWQVAFEGFTPLAEALGLTAKCDEHSDEDEDDDENHETTPFGDPFTRRPSGGWKNIE